MRVIVRARTLRETDRAIQIEGGAWLAMEKSLDLLVEEWD